MSDVKVTACGMTDEQFRALLENATKLRDLVADARRWRFYAGSAQTALMLGSTLDPNDEHVDWKRECDRLVDARIAGDVTR